jgi:hypothetical protein
MPTYYKRNTSGTTNWNLATSWSTVSSTSAVNSGTFPSSTTLDPVIFDANSSNVTVNVVSNCTSLDFTNYAGTITMTSNLAVYGNIILGASMGISGSGILSIGATSTYTSNNVTWTSTLQLGITNTITVTLGSLITTVQNLRVTAGASGQIQTVNSNTLNILGDLTMLSHLAGSTQLNLIGSGTWNSQGGTNSEVRTKLNIDTLGTITRGANGSAYAGLELKYTQGNLVNGSLYLLLSNNASTSSIISNGVNWGNVYILANNNTLTDDMNIDSLLFSSNAVVNGSNLRINGNISQPTGAVITGTTVFQVIGTGNQTWNAANTATRIANSMNIDKASGTFTITSANLSYGSATAVLTHTQGTFVPGTSTFLTPTGGVTFNIIGSGFSLNNWNPVIGTYTINTNPLVVNNSLLLAGSTTFLGTHGFTTQNFTCTLAASIITLQNINANPLAEYIVNGVLTLIGTAANRITLQAAGSATFNGTITPVGQLNYLSGTIPSVGMTVSQATGVSPVGLIGLLPSRPVITGGTSPTFTISPSATTVIGTSFSMRAGYKAKFTLTNGTGSQNVAYTTTQDIDSNAGATITSFGSNGDDINNSTISLFRTLNWGPLIAPSGSVYYTFVN